MSFLIHYFPMLVGIVGVVAAFSIAIFVHELGHFMFAKLFGVKVEAFAIGFGKKLIGFKRGDTEYKICALPFGGYVKMVGTVSKELEEIIEGKKPASDEEREDAVEAAEELSAPAPVSLAEGIQDEVNALRNKAYWKKLLVFAAGCINNVITAVVLLFLVSFIGYHRPPATPAVVGGIDKISVTASPIKVGDKVVSLGGEAVNSEEDFLKWFDDRLEKGNFPAVISAEVLRDGTTVSLELPATAPLDSPAPAGKVIAVGDQSVSNPMEAYRAAQALEAKGSSGTVTVKVQAADGSTATADVLPVAVVGPAWPILAYHMAVAPRIDMAIPNQPAEKAGFKTGDVITAVNDTPVASVWEATRIIRQLAGKQAKIDFNREGRNGDFTSKTITMEVRANPDSPSIGQIGVSFGPARTEFVREGFTKSATLAVERAKNIVTGYVDALKRIFGSSITTIRENLAGPVGISVQFYKIAQSGWFAYIVTFAAFNLILALTNLLPLPVLDGGHILFATIEAIIRRPLPAKVMVAIYNVFMTLIVGLALLITFNDLIMNAWRVIGK